MDTGVFNLFAGYTRCLQRDDESGDALYSFASCSHGRSAIIGEDAVGDPFLCSIDNVDISIPLCRGSYSGNIRSSCSCD